jgi:hypothetical protein
LLANARVTVGFEYSALCLVAPMDVQRKTGPRSAWGYRMESSLPAEHPVSKTGGGPYGPWGSAPQLSAQVTASS